MTCELTAKKSPVENGGGRVSALRSKQHDIFGTSVLYMSADYEFEKLVK